MVIGYSISLWAFWLTDGNANPYSTTFLALVAILAVGFLGLAVRKLRPWLALATVALSFQVIAAPIDAVADSNGALSLFDLDRYVWGLNLTGWVQRTFSSGALTAAASVIYTALVPIVLSAALLLWRRHKSVFSRFVVAMVLTSALALATFVLMPTVPPWLGGAADNLVHDSGLGALTAFVVPDYFASFPSLHAAYTLTCAYFLLRFDRRLGLAATLAAGATLFSTMYLGQHYAVDLIGGAAYSLVPCILAERLLSGATAAAYLGPAERAPLL